MEIGSMAEKRKVDAYYCSSVEGECLSRGHPPFLMLVCSPLYCFEISGIGSFLFPITVYLSGSWKPVHVATTGF
jgi:hypothetical protein